MSLIRKITMVALACFTLSSVTAHATTDLKISVQLWSVKNELTADFEGTLKKLSAMGFDGVEFAGNFGKFEKDPEGLKKFLADNGLQASGAHVGFDKFSDANFEQTVEFFEKLGAKYLIVPYDERAFNAKTVDVVNAELASIAKKLEKHGLKTGYHNHTPEFANFKGTTFWDYIGDNTPENVVLQLDVGWTAVAGKDPAAYIRKYPGRSNTLHFKAGLPAGVTDKVSLIGQDIVDWKSVITAAREVGGTEWFVVEQEVYPNNMKPLEAVNVSMKGLQKIISEMK